VPHDDAARQRVAAPGIIRLRTIAAHSPASPIAQRATPNSIRQRLDATRREISRLRAENTALRDQFARTLGQQRQTTDRCVDDMSTTQHT